MSCERCPCPADCTGRKMFCEWAAEVPQNPVRLRQVCDGSRVTRGTFPSLATQAGNALGAIGRVAGAVLTGQPVLVSTEEHGRRMAICLTCPEMDAAQNRCRACGCLLAVKPWGSHKTCPRGKWEKVEAL